MKDYAPEIPYLTNWLNTRGRHRGQNDGKQMNWRKGFEMKTRCTGISLLFATIVLLASQDVQPQSSPSAPGKGQPAVLVGAGDIADCRDLSGAEATAKLVEQIPGTVMVPGDLAYPDGSKENFECYDKTWGRVKSRTRPSPGNHEFHAAGAQPYS